MLHLPVAPEDFELLRGKNSLTSYTFGTGSGACHCSLVVEPHALPEFLTLGQDPQVAWPGLEG